MTTDECPGSYTYHIQTLATIMTDEGSQRYLHGESWTRPNGEVVHSRMAWSDKPLKTLEEFLHEMGFDNDI